MRSLNWQRRDERRGVGTEALESRLLLSGQVQLLKDINTATLGSNPTAVFDLNGIGYFGAAGKLWKADGTDGGTQQVLAVSGVLDAFGQANGQLLFVSHFAGTYSLWSSDGTATGTSTIKTLGNLGAVPLLVPLDPGHAVFSLQVFGDSGLWATDGTAAGTIHISDVIPRNWQAAPSANPSAAKADVARLNGRLYFGGTLEETEVWTTDGTATGTFQVANINGSSSSNPANFVAFNDRVYFAAFDQTNGTAFWKTDGTSGGTQLVKALGGAITLLTATTEQLYVSVGHNELWRSDGTTAGTFKVTNFSTGFPAAVGEAAVLGNQLFFAEYYVTDGVGHLWRAQGDRADLLHSFAVSRPNVEARPGNFATFNGRIYFSADDGVHGREPWTSDGTIKGTQLLADLRPGFSNSQPKLLSVFAGNLFVSAIDDAHGTEPFITDGTPAGTHLLRDLNTTPASSGIWDVTAMPNGVALFQATDASAGQELWRTDGTPEGTYCLTDVDPGAFNGLSGNGFDAFIVTGDHVAYFSAFNHGAAELWRTDGTLAGTRLVSDFGHTALWISGLTTVGDRAFAQVVLVNSSGRGALFTSDGTSAGTVELIHSTQEHPYYPGRAVTLDGIAYLSADSGVGVPLLYRSDGTAEGTSLVSNQFPGVGIPLNHKLISLSYDGIWVTDGTAKGTAQISQQRTEGFPQVYEGRIWFWTGGSADSLWVTDGTAAGTRPAFDSSPTGFTLTRPFKTGSGRLYVAAGAFPGMTVWSSDGTLAGTHVIADVDPLDAPFAAASIAGTLYFVGGGGVPSYFLCAADESGNVENLFPMSGAGLVVTALNGQVLFGGFDNAVGNELFAFTPDAPFAAIKNRTLYVSGDDHNDHVTVAHSGSASNITVNGLGTLSFADSMFDAIVIDTADGDDVIDYDGAGISQPTLLFAGADRDALNVKSGTLTFDRDARAGSEALTLNVAAGAQVVFAATQHLAGLNISGHAILAAGGDRRIVTETLTVSGLLDLNDHDLIVDYRSASPRGEIQSLINTARNGGSWNGATGITSSTARDANPRNRTLGLLEASDFVAIYGLDTTFAGETLDDSMVLVKYTYYGDTDFNGRVNFDDYVRTDNGFNNHVSGWMNGDFDGSGVVNFDDYVLIDLAFNTRAHEIWRPSRVDVKMTGGREQAKVLL
jgi:ELWxxDGT repeat protein